MGSYSFQTGPPFKKISVCYDFTKLLSFISKTSIIYSFYIVFYDFQDLFPLHGWWTNAERVQDSPDVQVVYLPALLPREAQLASDKPDDVPLPYSFDAFGRYYVIYYRVSSSIRAPDSDDTYLRLYVLFS